MKVGTILMPSIDFAYTPLTRPASEKIRLERKKNRIITRILKRVRCVKKSDTMSTRRPMSTPLTTPPITNPAMMTHGGVGETRISSIVRIKNFEEKNEKETLLYAFIIIASITIPGTTKRMYGTPSRSPMREPKNAPKIRK